ncbi:MAG: hypothetical protein IPP66_01405 [Anaerolineales bacterium]|nr:hypothetical protein [Anaerolineales bacterium]
MKHKLLLFITTLILATLACSAGQTPASSPTEEPASTSTSISSTEIFTPVPAPTETLTPTNTPIETFTPAPTETPTQTPLPVVEVLKAQVNADKLSCRYGPGAEYLYLFAFNGTANIKLVGRTDANNWVWVENKGKNNTNNNCWVNAKFLEIQGDPKSLPIVYPGLKLPVSPYYPGPSWAKATREGNTVEITWEHIPISPGKFADERMQQYIIEVWRCEAGQIIFETLGTNFPVIKVENDEAGCSTPSHGLVYLQEKHGYGGPVEVPWPPHE